MWKPAERLHFYADSRPVLLYFGLCIGSLSLSLYVMSLTAPRPNPKWYDRGHAGLNAADMRLNILQSSFFTVLNRNSSIWWRICSTKQKQQCIFIWTIVQIWPPGLQNYFGTSWGSKGPMSDCSGCHWFSDVSAPGV